jgi:hypothetical protein
MTTRLLRPNLRTSTAVLMLLAMTSASLPRTALAQAKPAGTSEQDKAMATDFFDKGLKKMELGRCDETPIKNLAACKEAREDFKRAYELYPAALGALRNLAYTEKGLGLVASAARSFRDLARKAPLDPKPERKLWADFARKEAADLEPRVPHLKLIIAANRPKGLKIKLDGADLPSAGWDAAIDVDPGKHVIHAEAPGHFPFDGTIFLSERDEKSLKVDLEEDKRPMKLVGPSKVPPIIVASAGLVGVGVGLGVGYLAMKKKNDVCDAKTKLCDPQGLSDGRSLATTSTIVTGVGGAVLVGGLVWLLLQPKPTLQPMADRATLVVPWASTDGFGVTARGVF